MNTPKLSNPFSTGGGGSTFENLIGAFYLVALLAEDIPRGLNQGIAKHIMFQQRYAGSIVDDIVVSSENASGQEFRLALQVKHDITFSNSKTNQIFPRVISDCWQTFTNSTKGNFNFDPSVDRLGIAFGVQPPAKIEHLQRALDWARTAFSANDYFVKLRTPHLASNDMRSYVEDVFRPLLNKAAGRNLTDDEVFRFIRCLVILHFDLEHESARDTTFVWNRLLDKLNKRDESEARQLAKCLFDFVATHNKDAAGFDYLTLIAKLGHDYNLKGRISCQEDIARLRRHTDLVLNGIPIDIGGTIRLPRSQQVSKLCTDIKQYGTRAVVIVGEPGTGKSALMKLVANHLRQENEVIVTEIDRLRGPSLESFWEMLQIEEPLGHLLGTMSAGSLRCLFIDGLERVHEDDDRCRVLEDIIRTINSFNERVLANGGHDESCWRVVLTCRKEQYQKSVRNTVLVEYAHKQTLRHFEVTELNDDEFQSIIGKNSRLKYLGNYERTSFLLKRPFYLNLLTKRENPLEKADLPQTLTETWFLKIFWEDVVCLGQSHHEREQILLDIFTTQLQTGNSFVPASGFNSNILNSLISDQIVRTEDMSVRMAHDLFEDWIGERFIASKSDQLVQLCRQAVYPITLLRSIELRALYHLEVNHNVEAWQRLASLKDNNEVPPSWRDVAIGVIFKSTGLTESLELAKPILLSEDSILLSHLLRLMRTVYTEPSAAIREVLVGIPNSAKTERHLAYVRDPIFSLWEPVLCFILSNQGNIPLVALPELAQVCQMWLQKVSTSLRIEVALFCYSYLGQPFDDLLDNLAYKKHNIITISSDRGTISNQVRHSLALGLLFAADCVPNYVKLFVREDLKQNNRSIVQELLLKDANWVSVGKYLPELLVEAAETILCWQPTPLEKIEEDYKKRDIEMTDLRRSMMSEENQYRQGWLFGGTRNDHTWRPPTYHRGPFYYFLRIDPEHGLKLIHKIINHATNYWRRCQELNNLTPLGQEITLTSGIVKVWGDITVYSWSRGAPISSNSVKCSLSALEKWLHDQIEAGSDPKPLFQKVLLGSNSLSIVGVLVSVALKYMSKCCSALLPILIHPVFWVADVHRLEVCEPMAMAGMFDFGMTESEFNSVQAWQKADYRSLRIDHIAQYLLMQGKETDQQVLKKAIQSFPNARPFFFAEESRSTQIVQSRREKCEIIASWANPDTWKFEDTEDGVTISVIPQLSPELKKKQKEREQLLKLQAKIWEIHRGGIAFRDEGYFQYDLTLVEAIRLINNKKKLKKTAQIFDLNHVLLEGIAGILAGLVIHKFDWLKTNDKTHWARQQLLNLNSRSNTTRQPIGVNRSVALATPILLKEKPPDKQLRSVARRLAQHPHYEVRSYLFRSLQILWDTDVDFVWECVAFGLSKSKLIRNKGRTKTYKLKRDWSVKLGLRQLALPKIVEHLPRDIDYYGLIAILSVFPSGNGITSFSDSNIFLDFVTDLLGLTIKAYHHPRENQHNIYDDYLRSALLVWDRPFGQVLANWIIYLPWEIALRNILKPILNEWVIVSDLLEKIMDFAIDICSEDPTTKQRFVRVWNEIAKVVLSCAEQEFKEDIFALLFCAGIFTSKEKVAKLPLDDLLDIFETGVQTIAHYNWGYKILIRFLKNAGFKYMISHGIRWLDEAWEQVPDKSIFLKYDQIVSDNANLLHDSWYEFGQQLQGNQDLLRRFSGLVDYLAGQGNQIAVELQRKIRSYS